ncbi:MAG: alkaline phosphatase family protein [Granulosicoccus sp.]
MHHVEKSPNILLITADQFRGDCLSSVGHPVVKTPNLDALAAEGVSFLRHYANAAPCSPARACLYTGLYQMNNRVCSNGSPLDSRHDNLALAFRRLGYEPTLFGHTDQATDPRKLHNNDPALHTYETVLSGFTPRAVLPEPLRPWLSWLESVGYGDALHKVDPHLPVNGVADPPAGAAPFYRAEHTETAYLVNEFTRWLSEQQQVTRTKQDHRWFAHVSLYRPHPPFIVPAPFDTQYAADDVPPFAGATDWQETARLHPLLEWLFSTLDKSQFIAGSNGPVRDWHSTDLKQIAATYFGMVSEVDSQLGRLMNALKNRDCWDNTLIVFTSDHGEMLGDHAMLGKHGFFESSYHIPLIIRDPCAQLSKGTQVDRFTESVDVFPTLLDRLGVDAPSQLDGRSMSAFIDNKPAVNWRTAAHWEFDFRDIPSQVAEQHFDLTSQQCNLAVYRDTQVKYVHFSGLPPLLFDLQKNPEETRNVVDDPAYASIRIACAEAMLAWRSEHLDQSLALTALTEQGVVRA